jgi:hypothetical protein
MNHTTLAIVAVLAASALIIGTTGMLQPAAAHHFKKNDNKKNQALAVQQVHQNFICGPSGSPSQNNCNNSYNQAANIAVFDHVHVTQK